MTDTLTPHQRQLLALARQMAATNPNAAEYLAEELARQVRREKAPLPVGIVVDVNFTKEQVEIRGGDLERGYWQDEPGASYAEVVFPLPRVGTAKTE